MDYNLRWPTGNYILKEEILAYCGICNCGIKIKIVPIFVTLEIYK